jgi:hypothetical protein
LHTVAHVPKLINRLCPGLFLDSGAERSTIYLAIFRHELLWTIVPKSTLILLHAMRSAQLYRFPNMMTMRSNSPVICVLLSGNVAAYCTIECGGLVFQTASASFRNGYISKARIKVTKIRNFDSRFVFFISLSSQIVHKIGITQPECDPEFRQIFQHVR